MNERGFDTWGQLAALSEALRTSMDPQTSWESIDQLQREMVLKVFEAPTYLERRAALTEMVPQVQPAFFGALAIVAGMSERHSDVAMVICEELLDIIGLNDLRERWSDPEQIIIWGCALFVNRENKFMQLAVLVETNQLIYYGDLLKAVRHGAAFADNDSDSIGLAMLNVVLALSPRASDTNRVSKHKLIKSSALKLGARITSLLREHRATHNAMRMLLEARTLLNEMANQEEMRVADRVEYLANTAAVLNSLGDLLQGEKKAEEALKHHREALDQHKIALELAKAPEVDADLRKAVAWGVPNSLRHLAQAEVALWRLDEACDHYEQANDEYRHLGLESAAMIRNLHTQVVAEVMRANFEGAELLLEEVSRLKQQ